MSDPLSFDAMRNDRAMWEECQRQEYESLVASYSRILGAAITTRFRLESLLHELLKAASAENVLPGAAKVLKRDKPFLADMIQVCLANRLVDSSAANVMGLIKDIGNAFAHDGVISAIEAEARPLFDDLRNEMAFVPDRNEADDVALLVAAFAQVISWVRDWRSLGPDLTP